MNTLDALKLIGGIVKNELSLSADQIFIYNQKYTIPSDSREYYVIGLLSSKPFATGLEYEVQQDGSMKEIVTTNVQDVVYVEIMSRAISPLNKHGEIIAALRGTYSQQVQQTYGMYIAMLPQNVVPINEEEGAAILYRLQIPVVIQYFKRVEKAVNYYKEDLKRYAYSI
jgi:hypothetical protein